MPKIKIEGTWGTAGVVSAITQIQLSGPKGKELLNIVEAGKYQTIIETVGTAPNYKDPRLGNTQLPLKGFGGGATCPPMHPLAKGNIRVYIKFDYMANYKAKDGTTQPMKRELLIAHELGHCRAIQEGIQSDKAAHKLAIKYANPVFVELGSKERDETV
jgi:hypothetical protein